MSRNITEAAGHLMRADDEELKTIARHDPDMIRDVAAALSSPRAPDTSPSVDGELLKEAIRPHLIDNDLGEITVTLNDKELRGWSYKDDAERRTKMLAAREYVEGWYDGRDVR